MDTVDPTRPMLTRARLLIGGRIRQGSALALLVSGLANRRKCADVADAYDEILRRLAGAEQARRPLVIDEGERTWWAVDSIKACCMSLGLSLRQDAPHASGIVEVRLWKPGMNEWATFSIPNEWGMLPPDVLRQGMAAGQLGKALADFFALTRIEPIDFDRQRRAYGRNGHKLAS